MKFCKGMMILAAISLCGCAGAKKQPATAATGTAAPKASVQACTPAANPDLVKLSCTKGDETRLLEVTLKGSGCSLDYTKQGKVSAVATSAHGKKHCVDTQKKIQGKLTAAGYKCA